MRGWLAVLMGLVVLAGCSAASHPQSGLSAVAADRASGAVNSPSTSPSTSPTPSPSPSPAFRQVLGLGDSVTAGNACGCTDFVRLLARELTLRTGQDVTPTNLGHAGQTSGQLLALVRSDQATRSAVRAADVVLVTIGANDLVPALRGWDDGRCDDDCASSDVDAITSRVAAIVREVHALRAGQPTRVLATNYWNVFEDGEVARADRGEAYLGWSDRLTRAFDAALCPKVEAEGATCLDLYAPFKAADGSADPSALLADDGDHPNAAGHALIARVMLAQLLGSSR